MASNNYHWTETNITSPLSIRIKEKILSLGYKISQSDIQGQIFNRMNKKKVNYFITIKAKKDKELIIKDFDPFSTKEEIICDDENDKERIFSFIKELENELLNYTITYATEEKPTISYKMTCKKDDFFKFMFEDNYILQWCPSFKRNECYNYGSVLIRNVTFNDSECIFELKISNEFIKCKFTFTEDSLLSVFVEKKQEILNLFNEFFSRMGMIYKFNYTIL